MKKIVSQIWIGIICLILGFMITYQFKINNSSKAKYAGRQMNELVKEIEGLTKKKNEMELKVQEYQKKVDEYEKTASNVSLTAKKMKEELEDLRKLAGLTDVEGKGVVLTITPNPSNDISLDENTGMEHLDLLDIVNLLNSTGEAEAISINGERYTSRTEIIPIPNMIKINDAKTNPFEPYVIEAIGSPDILSGVFSMPGNIKDYLESRGFTVKIEKKDNIKILKYNKVLTFRYIK